MTPEVTSAEMCVDAHVTSGAGQAFVFTVRNMLLRRRVDVFFSETKVDDVHQMLFPVGVSTDQEVLWLYVAVDELL